MAVHFTSVWEDVVFRHSRKTALSGPALRLTYGQLDASARQVAAWLNEKKVRGHCVVILLDDPADSIICMLGALLSGNYYFYPGEAATAKSLREYMSYTDVGAIVKTAGTVTGFSVPELSWGDQYVISGSALSDHTEVSPYFAVFSTSGSTGVPKLVRHTVDFIIRESLQGIDLMQITADDRRDYGGSLTFSASLGAIYPTFLAGAELVLHSVTGKDIFNLPGYWREAGITLTSIPVSVLRTLARSDTPLDNLGNLRLIIVTAEAMSAGDMELFSTRLPANVTLMNGYATTETRGISIVAHRLTGADAVRPGAVGWPVAGKSVYILGEQGEVLPRGESGEIVVEAGGLPDGYLNYPVSDSFFYSSEGLPCFRTGDIGHIDGSGCLFLEGRRDDVVKINGIKVNLQDIEKRLLQYPGIREAAVFMNEGSDRIQACYAADGGIHVTMLRSWLAETLSPLHIPTRWTAVSVLPKTVTGKIDRQKLKMELATQKDVVSAPDENTDPGDLIRLIMQVWKKELELNQEIGAHDDFFTDLGGNSLLAAICTHEIEERIGLTLPLGAGNTYSTPALMTAFIKGIYDRPAHCIPIGDFDNGRPSLYFIPPYPGDRRTYRHLETRLAGAYNLFFLFYNPIDPSGNITPFSVLTDALADQVSVAGHIHLFGFSFGGIMAYFLAMKLEERNKTVSFLELLDTPLYHKLTGAERAYNLTVRTMRKVGQFVEAPVASWNKYIRHFGSAYKAYRENFTNEKHKEDPHHPSQVIWHYTRTFPPYKPLKAAIVLFSASERGGEYVFRQDFSWQRYTQKNLRKVPLTGWHVELLASEDNLDRIQEAMLNLQQD